MKLELEAQYHQDRTTDYEWVMRLEGNNWDAPIGLTNDEAAARLICAAINAVVAHANGNHAVADEAAKLMQKYADQAHEP